MVEERESRVKETEDLREVVGLEEVVVGLAVVEVDVAVDMAGLVGLD